MKAYGWLWVNEKEHHIKWIEDGDDDEEEEEDEDENEDEKKAKKNWDLKWTAGE